MSAIFGVFNRDGREVDRHDLAGMAESLAHRGPDRNELWQDGIIGLGQSMLWTTPESVNERLRKESVGSHLVIASDARIDNREEVAAELGKGARGATGLTDGELIGKAYEQWDLRCPERLVGDFAFAIWDRQRGRLFCAVDQLGSRSLYYFSSPAGFAFATEIKALLKGARIPRRLNEAKVADFLGAQLLDPSINFYEGIWRLPPGHSIAVTEAESDCRQYWMLDPYRQLVLDSDEEYVEAFTERLKEAVRCRLRTQHRIGSTLSGGLDSSSVATLASKLQLEGGGAAFPTFSACFERDSDAEERPYLDAVLANNGALEPHRWTADDLSPLAESDRMMWHLDEPLRGGNSYLLWHTFDLAAQNQVRVLLSGFDGDTTVSHGEDQLARLATSGSWIKLLREVKAYAQRLDEPYLAAYWSWLRQFGLTGKGGSMLTGAAEAVRALKKGRRLQPISSEAKRFGWNGIIREDLARRVGLPDREREDGGIVRNGESFHYKRVVRIYMKELVDIQARMAGGANLEVRSPFMDKRLVEFCVALPPSQKLQMGFNRMVLRRAMQRELPSTVVWRAKKSSYSASFEKGLRRFAGDRLRQLATRKKSPIGAFVDFSRLETSFNRFESGNYNEADVMALWRSLCLDLWLSHADLAG